MNRRFVAAMALAGSAICGTLWWLHQSDAPARSTKLVNKSVDFPEQLYASQAQPVRYRQNPAPPTATAAPLSAPAAPVIHPPTESAERPPKSASSGFAQGMLPTSHHLSSTPRIQASPRLKEAYQARVDRAALLDRRLERHLTELRAKARNAGATERTALERDIAILEAQLVARRPYESPNKPIR